MRFSLKRAIEYDGTAQSLLGSCCHFRRSFKNHVILVQPRVKQC